MCTPVQGSYFWHDAEILVVMLPKGLKLILAVELYIAHWYVAAGEILPCNAAGRTLWEFLKEEINGTHHS